MTAAEVPSAAANRCVACAGNGFRWGRGRMGEPRMVKRQCGTCKGTGKSHIKASKA